MGTTAVISSSSSILFIFSGVIVVSSSSSNRQLSHLKFGTYNIDTPGINNGQCRTSGTQSTFRSCTGHPH
eukprot:scaffold65173_cov63-Cyclotella_meneghiniana.AAC.1